MAANRGFTLLELLLVLALAAMLTALVAPRTGLWAEGAGERAALDSVRTFAARMPTKAFFSAQPLQAGVGDAGWPALPEGWNIETSRPLRWDATGMTQGARLRVRNGKKLLADWVIERPTGTVRAATPDDGPFFDPSAAPSAGAAAGASASTLADKAP